MNVTYKDRIPAELNAVYSLEWQSPNIVLRPQSLSLKEIALPLSMLETIVIPLDLPAQDIVTVRDVSSKDQIKILFKLQIQLSSCIELGSDMRIENGRPRSYPLTCRFLLFYRASVN